MKESPFLFDINGCSNLLCWLYRNAASSCNWSLWTNYGGTDGSICTAFVGHGIKVHDWKGQRSKAVCEAIVRNQAVYFCALGGAGALAAKCIKKCDVIAFEDLGCESVKRLEFEDFR